MKNTFIVYMSIVLLLIFIMAIYTFLSFKKTSQMGYDVLSMLVLILIWPTTLFAMIVLYIYESLREFQKKKIKKILIRYGATSIDECIHSLTLKELKQVKFAYKIGAAYISPQTNDLVEHHIIEKYFEEIFVGLNNEKKKNSPNG